MATYYYAEGGGAANKEAATGGAYPAGCMSPATCNSESAGFSPGDFCLASDEGGDIRTEMGVSCASGTSGNMITWGIKSGDSPILNGADVITGWTLESGSTWQATVTTRPQQVFIDDTFGTRHPDLATVQGGSEYGWFWSSNVLYLYAPGDPDTEYTKVEASQRELGLAVQSDYITVDGIHARYANRNGIGGQQAGDHVVVENCLGEWNWYKGVGPESLSEALYIDWTIQDCICRYNGVGGIGHGIVFEEGIIRRNECYENGKYQPAGNSYDQEQYDWSFGIKIFELNDTEAGCEIYENVCHTNGRGEFQDAQGAGCGIWIDHATGTAEKPYLIHHNLVYDNMGNGIFIEISSHCYVYGNVGWDNGNSAWQEPANIVLDSRYDFKTENNLIYNNTFVGGYYGIKLATYAATSECSVSDNIIKNNIITGASVRAVYTIAGGDNDGVHGSGNLFSKNCFGAESTGFIEWEYTACDTYDAYLSKANGMENIQPDNNIEADPSFTDAGSDDYTLAAGSPCIGVGENLGSPYDAALISSSSWPDAVATGSQDDY